VGDALVRKLLKTKGKKNRETLQVSQSKGSREKGRVMRKKSIDSKRYETKEYWEKLLTDYGLGMSAGRSDRESYVGDSAQIERVAGQAETDVGRCTPKPAAE